MCVLIFSITFVRNISHSKKNSARCDHKCKLVFIECTCYSCQTLWNLNFLATNSNIKFQENSSSGSRVVPYGRADGGTDRHDEANSRFRNFAKAPKNSFIFFIIVIEPLGRSGQRPEFSQATGMALVRCILGKFLGVTCHCFPPLFLDVPTFHHQVPPRLPLR